MSAIHSVLPSADRTMSSGSRGPSPLYGFDLVISHFGLKKKILLWLAWSVLSSITMKPDLVATRPDNSSSFVSVTLQIFLPGVALTLTVGTGSSANALDGPTITKPP